MRDIKGVCFKDSYTQRSNSFSVIIFLEIIAAQYISLERFKIIILFLFTSELGNNIFQ